MRAATLQTPILSLKIVGRRPKGRPPGRGIGNWLIGSLPKSWELLPNRELKELCKAAKEHRQGSHFFKNLVEATFSVHTLVLHDIKNIMNCLISPAEYMLWERHWKKNLKTLADNYAKDVNHPNLTIEQMAREGNFLKPTDQARDLPEAVLHDVAAAAKTSLSLTSDDSTPTQSFTTIKQGFNESFIKFVDRLKVVLEKQTESPEGKKEVLNKMAIANANAQCKAILRALPIDPEPSIEQMVEACARYTSSENTVVQAVTKGIVGGVTGAFAAVAEDFLINNVLIAERLDISLRTVTTKYMN
ncbi:uncharacterized protein LOC107203630 isoform X1 [Parus major]|uniref:uncharacterized protein LOC107203630 isoform X1 n=1 Tax=Parus major TaxID=9157 RepID=UPI0007712A26|nr:uncharacterized protein LOC107203630 isoform X1 [Parus major]XP_015481405.1 uncharacterized protein LOC107203630 isoform X1 [Parus major]